MAVLNGGAQHFATFRTDIVATIHRLKEQGVARVVLSTEDSYSCAVGFFAALYANCRIVIPPNNLSGMLINFVTRDCPHLSDTTYGDNPHFIKIGGAASGQFNFEELDPEKCWLEFFTSGSTGSPQKIPKTLFQIDEELVVLQKNWGEMLSAAATLGTVSHQHIYGLYFRVLWPLCAGRPFYAERFEIWEELIAQAPSRSCFVSSPAHLSRIPPFDPLSANQNPLMILSAGGPLNFKSSRNAAKIFGTYPTEIFGSTETGGIAFRQQETATTPFSPLLGMEVRIDQIGKLSVKSKYTDKRDWAETNDIAKLFEDGRFLLIGRANQFVKIEGKRISLAEIEKYLLRSDLIADAIAVVLNDERASLAAAIELTEAGWQLHEKIGPFRLNRHLRHFLNMYLESAALPRRWRFVQRLPLNSQGKRVQKEIDELFEG
ncbi:AMP-binding protein [Sneathiella marina]|uniref:AMP-binding protein n=1 Tax=Sneathiella marina TaxID=2950108 RepID=A0ABY4W603_9PROT|nr:AMP-binding protein [Sneathiella marina]USG62616.1 AMP-binding protein [Sneathiella marina]